MANSLAGDGVTATSKAEAIALGLKRYTTGEPCKRGHFSARGLNGMCCECSTASKKAFRARNPGESARYRAKYREEILVREQAWREKNRGREIARQRTHYYANRGKIAKRRQESRDANPERFKEYATKTRAKNKHKIARRVAEYHIENREKRLQQKKEYRLKNMDRWRIYRAKRRAKEAGFSTAHTAADVEHIFKLQKGRCGYCRTDLKKAKRHVDHITALSKGGHPGKRNLQILCQPCNLKKHAKDPIDFAQSLGMLL